LTGWKGGLAMAEDSGVREKEGVGEQAAGIGGEPGISGRTRADWVLWINPQAPQDEAAADSDRGHPAATQKTSPLAPSALSIVRRF
jgi:hypothetical protein